MRLGANAVTIFYRRTQKEMPAQAEEVYQALEEGIEVIFLVAPSRVYKENNNLKLELIRMELGEPDDSGRRRPIRKPDTEFIREIDMAIPALGIRPNSIIPSTTESLELTRWGTVATDKETGRTSKEGVWCGGDMATGADIVISAMGVGKRDTANIDEFFKS